MFQAERQLHKIARSGCARVPNNPPINVDGRSYAERVAFICCAINSIQKPKRNEPVRRQRCRGWEAINHVHVPHSTETMESDSLRV